MEKAIDAVRAGMSLCKAQKEFGVPKQTLSDRINERWKSTSLVELCHDLKKKKPL